MNKQIFTLTFVYKILQKFLRYTLPLVLFENDQKNFLLEILVSLHIVDALWTKGTSSNLSFFNFLSEACMTDFERLFALPEYFSA